MKNQQITTKKLHHQTQKSFFKSILSRFLTFTLTNNHHQYHHHHSFITSFIQKINIFTPQNHQSAYLYQPKTLVNPNYHSNYSTANTYLLT